MYEMTVGELLETLISRRKGLGYKLWKEAYLIGLAFSGGKKYPKTPEKASPELFIEKKKTIPMPENLLMKRIQQLKGNYKYE